MYKWKELPFILSTDYVLLSIVLTQYLEERDPDKWSYVEFLNLNRDTIIKLPPFNVKWASLDGTWYRQFLEETRELDPASANTLKERVFYFFYIVGGRGLLTRLYLNPEVFSALSVPSDGGETPVTSLLAFGARSPPIATPVKSEQNMKDYWEKMIIEQKELSVKRTHISGSLDLLNDAGEYNTQRLRDQGFNEDEEGKSSGKALRKRKKVCYTEETEMDSDYSDYSDHEWKLSFEVEYGFTVAFLSNPAFPIPILQGSCISDQAFPIPDLRLSVKVSGYMAYVELLKEIISDKYFTIVKFYKKLDFPFAQKKEEILYESLKTIASENNVKAQKLLESLDKLINSNSLMSYWDGINIQNEKNNTQFIKDALREKEHIIESNLLFDRKRKNKGEGLSTPQNKVRIFDTGYNSDSGLYSGEPFSPSCEAVPRSLTNVFLELKELKDSDVGAVLKSMNLGDDYILEPKDYHEQSNPEVQQKLISEPVEGNHLEIKQYDCVPKPKVTMNKWLWNGLDICNSLRDNKNARMPLNIDVMNFHNNLCTEPLPSSMITYIQEQMENEDVNIIFFDDGKKFGINKFSIDIDEEVMKYLNAFQDC
ncbi:8385_t:CDS:10, partial [Funneliformis geosporum]